MAGETTCPTPMMLHPVFPPAVLWPLAFMSLLAAGWLCARACRGMAGWLRGICTLLILLVVAMGFALLLNPGHTEERPSPHAPLWVVALDVSASMAAPVQDDPAAESRMEIARRALTALEEEAGGREVRWVAVAESLRVAGSARELAASEPTGRASRIMGSLAGYLDNLRQGGRMVAGVILLSDGRDTSPQDWQELVSRAGAAGCPVHVLPLGDRWQEPDVTVRTSQPFLRAYPGVETLLAARVGNKRMGQRQLVAELYGEDGSLLQSQPLELQEGEEREVVFRLPAASGVYAVRVEVQPGESRADNNEVRITVRPVDAPIRVLLAEGAPYWDSKFLAQYLRGQSVFEVHSVHRLSEGRFYHIRAGVEDDTPSDTPDMPASLEGLAAYDVVVLGKGMEHLMDGRMVSVLKKWVSAQGGLLVMARGRCFAGKLEGMDELEPFVWGESGMGEGRLEPAGDEGHLFGQLLPGAEAPVWASLPPLEDIGGVADCRPLTRVLAKAQGTETPLLGMMRYGLGAVLCLNGEGLWKWDFYPEARGKRNMYREFWRHFLPWVQTAAEFMPGFDLSLHLERASVAEGEEGCCLLGWRGISPPSDVRVQVISLQDGQLIRERKSQPVPSDAMPRWECPLGTLPAGEYLLRGVAGDTPQPECRFSVCPPPSEGDCCDANPGLLARVAEATGGRVLPAPSGEWPELFALPEGVRATEAVYRPLWVKAYILAAMGVLLGLYWLLRRRKGMP